MLSLIAGATLHCGAWVSHRSCFLWWSTGSRPPGFSSCSAQASLIHVGSSWTRDQTRVSCIGRWILYQWATRGTSKIHSLSLTFDSLNVSWRRSFGMCLGCCLSFTDLYIQFLPWVWEILRYYLNSLLPSQAFLSEIVITLMSHFLRESDNSQNFLILKYLISLSSSSCIISRFVLKLTNSFFHTVCSISDAFSNTFLISFIELFSSRICLVLFC